MVNMQVSFVERNYQTVPILHNHVEMTRIMTKRAEVGLNFIFKKVMVDSLGQKGKFR
jgi:hypothetical protein